MDLKLNIFIAYSREDDTYRIRLEKHLSTLKRREYINTWYDGKIDPGTEWKYEIDNALNTADIILLLISADFIASDYCYEIEMKRAIERHERGETIVIPILLHNCDWEDTAFGRIQALPQNGKPVTDRFWDSPETSLSQIAKAIKSLVEKRIDIKKSELLNINSKISQAEKNLGDLEAKCLELMNEKKTLEIDKNLLKSEITKHYDLINNLLNEINFLKENIISLENQNLKKYRNRIKKLEQSLQYWKWP